MAAPKKKIIAPWIAAAVMALLFVGTLATVVGNLAAGYSEMAQYAANLKATATTPTSSTRTTSSTPKPPEVKRNQKKGPARVLSFFWHPRRSLT